MASGPLMMPGLLSLIRYVRLFPVRGFSLHMIPERSSFRTTLEQRLLSMPSSLLSSDWRRPSSFEPISSMAFSSNEPFDGVLAAAPDIKTSGITQGKT